MLTISHNDKHGTVIPHLNKTHKNINQVRHPSSAAAISILSQDINNFYYIMKEQYDLHFNAFSLILFALGTDEFNIFFKT